MACTTKKLCVHTQLADRPASLTEPCQLGKKGAGVYGVYTHIYLCVYIYICKNKNYVYNSLYTYIYIYLCVCIYILQAVEYVYILQVVDFPLGKEQATVSKPTLSGRTKPGSQPGAWWLYHQRLAAPEW